MKVLAVTLSSLFLLSSLAWSSQPPPPKTLAERVDLATHIIVGTAKSVRVVTMKTDEKYNIDVSEVVPEPDPIQANIESVEIEIEVNEVLYPTQWQVPKTIKYFFGGGWFSVKSIREDLLGKQQIYIMSANQYGHLRDGTDFFTPSYGWHLFDSMQGKTAISELVKSRVKREQKPQNPK